MKSCLTVVFVAAWLTMPAIAQEEAPARERPKGGKMQPVNLAEKKAKQSQGQIKRIRRMLDLDDQQKEQFDKIAAEFAESNSTEIDRDKQKELAKEYRAAQKSGDKERAEELRQELRRIRSGRPMDEFFDSIEEILNEEQLEKLGEIRSQMASPHGGKRGPLAQLSQLRGKLKLDRKQTEQYNDLYAKLQEDLGSTKGDPDAERELAEEILKAAQAGDDAKREELQKQLPNRRGQSDALVAEFLDDVESILEPNQKKILDRYRESMKRGESKMRVADYFRIAQRLDLDPEQKQALRQLQDESRKAERDARRDPALRAELTEEVKRQIRDILNDEQCAEYDRLIEQRESPRGGRDKRGQKERRPKRPDRDKQPEEEDETP